jgi:hypothetical protein
VRVSVCVCVCVAVRGGSLLGPAVCARWRSRWHAMGVQVLGLLGLANTSVHAGLHHWPDLDTAASGMNMRTHLTAHSM